MTLFLRSKQGKTILDLEVFKEVDEDHKYVELHSVVNIKNYSELLLDCDNKNRLISDFYYISELRGWLWEDYFMVTKNTHVEYENVVKELKHNLKEIGNRYGLILVHD